MRVGETETEGELRAAAWRAMVGLAIGCTKQHDRVKKYVTACKRDVRLNNVPYTHLQA